MDPSRRDTLVVWASKRFLKITWPHAPRTIGERDQGFESTFRNHFWEKFHPDAISTVHDLKFGAGLSTLSGLNHELDLLARWANQEWVFELKNGGGSEINKEMLMVFHEKILDFYLANYGFLSDLRIMRGFLTGAAYINDNLRAYCAAWGIVLIDNELLPIPALPTLLAEKKKWAAAGELANTDEEEIDQTENLAQELLERACRPLGEIIELSDLQSELTIRLDRIAQGAAAMDLVKLHRAICARMDKWDSLRLRRDSSWL